MPLHTFVRFEPAPGKENLLREELRLVLEPTRAEPGCIGIQLYEAVREPLVFYIHSEWVDEAAFDAHPKLLEQGQDETDEAGGDRTTAAFGHGRQHGDGGSADELQGEDLVRIRYRMPLVE